MSEKGKKVTIVEMLDSIASDLVVHLQHYLLKRLQEKQVAILTKTEMTDPLPDEVKQNMIEGSYLKRMAEPEDIAKAILYLSSDEMAFVTGQVLLVDGGFSLKKT